MIATVVDLFCGIGGLTKGLELSGLKVIAGVDNDQSCRFAYEYNNKAKFINGDITQISPLKIKELYSPDDYPILVGCAPCQPFSNYTQRYRKEGRKDNKWRLVSSFYDQVQGVNPVIVAMENVPELEKEDIYKNLVKNLENLGYKVESNIVSCQEYGIPQKRRRLVLLASLLGEISLVEPWFNVNNYRTVRDVIGNLKPLQNGESDPLDPIHCCSKLNSLNLERIRNSVPGGTWQSWPEELKLGCHKKKSGKSYSSIYGRMSWDDLAPTITTKFYGYGNGRFGHPEQDRALTYREGALLQTFPGEYEFIEKDAVFNKRELGVHIGNAVPVELGRAIGMSIINHLKTKGIHYEWN